MPATDIAHLGEDDVLHSDEDGVARLGEDRVARLGEDRVARLGEDRVARLGDEIQHLAAELHRASKTGEPTTKYKLLDRLDELRTKLEGPTQWPFSFLGPPDFAAMQVAFQRDIFQKVPTDRGADITLKELAVETNMDEDRLLRIMRLLAANRMFVEKEEKRFAHTELSAGLAQEYVAASVGGQLHHLFQACSSLAETIEQGHPNAWVARFGMPLYEHFEKMGHKDRARFAKSMVQRSQEEMKEVSTIFPWKSVRRIVDIGGGAGHLAAYLAHDHDHLELVSQDLPNVINDAKVRVANLPEEQKRAYDRIELEAHNYYEPQPRREAEVFIIRHCLHNSGDADCVRVLRAAILGLEDGGPDAKLLIIERLLPLWGTTSTRYETKWLLRQDVTMMISCGGKERTIEAFSELLKKADRRFFIDHVYHGTDHVAVMVVKLAPRPYMNGV